MVKTRDWFKKSELVDELQNFKLNETISFSDIIRIWKEVDLEYKTFAISNQIKRVYIIPYVVMFYTDKSIVINPFMDMFEKLKELIREHQGSKRFEEFSPRLIVNSSMVFIDIFPNSQLRHNTHLYSMDKEVVNLDEVSIEELAEHQELEIRKVKRDQFTLSKRL